MASSNPETQEPESSYRVVTDEIDKETAKEIAELIADTRGIKESAIDIEPVSDN